MENDRLKQLLIKYAVAVAICTGIFFMVLFMRDFFSQTELSQKIRYLSDAFTISGVLTVSFSLLIFLSDEGAFDGIGYALKSAIRVIIPMTGVKKAESYKDYRDRKHSKGKVKGYAPALITGLFFLLLGIVFMIIFNYV